MIVKARNPEPLFSSRVVSVMAESDRPDTAEKEESSQNEEKKKETTEAVEQEVNIALEKEEENENDVEHEKPHIKWVMKYDKPLPQVAPPAPAAFPTPPPAPCY